MGVIAVIWGILSLAGMALALIPCLGWVNWVNIPFAVVGLVISLVAAARPEGRSNGAAGAVMNGIAIGVGVVRLYLGGGFV